MSIQDNKISLFVDYCHRPEETSACLAWNILDQLTQTAFSEISADRAAVQARRRSQDQPEEIRQRSHPPTRGRNLPRRFAELRTPSTCFVSCLRHAEAPKDTSASHLRSACPCCALSGNERTSSMMRTLSIDSESGSPSTMYGMTPSAIATQRTDRPSVSENAWGIGTNKM